MADKKEIIRLSHEFHDFDTDAIIETSFLLEGKAFENAKIVVRTEKWSYTSRGCRILSPRFDSVCSCSHRSLTAGRLQLLAQG